MKNNTPIICARCGKEFNGGGWDEITYHECVKPIRTNGDRIRAMSDEQLSELHRWSDCDDCIAREYCRGEMYMEKECKEIVLEWLKQEVE